MAWMAERACCSRGLWYSAVVSTGEQSVRIKSRLFKCPECKKIILAQCIKCQRKKQSETVIHTVVSHAPCAAAKLAINGSDPPWRAVRATPLPKLCRRGPTPAPFG